MTPGTKIRFKKDSRHPYAKRKRGIITRVSLGEVWISWRGFTAGHDLNGTLPGDNRTGWFHGKEILEYIEKEPDVFYLCSGTGNSTNEDQGIFISEQFFSTKYLESLV